MFEMRLRAFKYCCFGIPSLKRESITSAILNDLSGCVSSTSLTASGTVFSFTPGLVYFCQLAVLPSFFLAPLVFLVFFSSAGALAAAAFVLVAVLVAAVELAFAAAFVLVAGLLAVVD